MHRELGVDVTIVELLPSIVSTEGKSISETLTLAFKKKGIKIETSAQITDIKKTTLEGVTVAEVSLADGRKLQADAVLICVGRSYNSAQIGLENTGVIVEKNGSIPTNEKMETNVSHIYAIGDVTGKWLLAHVASHQGLVAADNATNHPAKINYRAVPSVIYTYPETASIGLTLEKALEAGYDAVVGKFPFQALGKAQAIKETDGFAQVVVSKTSGQILGAQIVGYGSSNLITEIAVAIQNELTVHELSDTIHPHPTMSEAWMEAAFQAMGIPLHLPPPR
jgi:dihydrolipoamide dehydrogenase